jgi:predicted amidohydrolase YtcJ
MKKLVLLLTLFALNIALFAGCTSSDTKADLTKISPSPNYHIRVELSSSSVWADLRIQNVQDVISAELISASEGAVTVDASPGGQAIDQPMSVAEDGGEVSVTVDYEVKAVGSEGGLAFRLQRDSLNGCTVRIFHVVGGETQLVYELEHQDEIDEDDNNTIYFTLDLNTMTVAMGETLPQPTQPITDAASIIFHNGTVLTIDEQNNVFEAIAIQGDQILAVGNNAEILTYQGDNTILIDLQGRTLMPGFEDGHNHIFRNPSSRADLGEGQDYLLKNGYTSSTEMAADDDYITDMIYAEDTRELRVRLNIFPMYTWPDLSSDGETEYAGMWYPENGPILDHDRMVRVPGIKVFTDGGAGPGCYAFSEPYSAEAQAADAFKQNCFSEYGDLYYEQDELNQIVADAQAAGFRVAFHANGDRAIETVLNAIEYALNGQPNDQYRHQIQHSLFIREDLLDRYVELDVLSSLRGHFHSCFSYGYDWKLLTNKYLLPSLGVHAYLETDTNLNPGDIYRPLDPFINMWGLVTRKQMDQNNIGNICDPPPGVSTNDAITIEMALRMMTIEPAYAVSQEDYLGSLEPGKFADIVVLAENPLTLLSDELMNNEVLMTMVGGNTEYCAPGQEAFCP